jgi:hypothetical protein
MEINLTAITNSSKQNLIIVTIVFVLTVYLFEKLIFHITDVS